MWKKRHFAVGLVLGLGFSVASYPPWRRLYESIIRRSARSLASSPHGMAMRIVRHAIASNRQIQPRPTCASLLEAGSPLDSGSTMPPTLQLLHATLASATTSVPPLGALTPAYYLCILHFGSPLTTSCSNLFSAPLAHAGTAVAASSMSFLSSEFALHCLCAPAWSPSTLLSTYSTASASPRCFEH